MGGSGGGLARLERRKKGDVLVRRALIALGTLGVVGGGLLALAYSGVISIGGITPPDEFRSYVRPPAALPGPTPQSAIMSHVLVIDSWGTMAEALPVTDALQGRFPNLVFFLTPLDVDGTLEYALYVGPAYSAAEATALREPVAVANTRENPDAWSVRKAPYAFYFGEYRSVANAQGRVQALARSAIPAYSLQVVYADGRTRVRVYGGAFKDEIEAEEMGRMVTDAGVGAIVLTSRRGTVPGPDDG